MDDEITAPPSAITGDYELKGKIGGGKAPRAAATVWRAVKKSSGQEVAVKCVRTSTLSRRLLEGLECELEFLAGVRHANIVRLFDVVRNDGCISLILELCTGGDLANYIQNHGRMHENIALEFVRQIGAGLEVLHSHHVIHRDLKPQNILLSTSGNTPVLKIADLGMARVVNPREHASMVCGTPLYMAPEVMLFEKYNEKVDMWSVGAILFELLNGYPPYKGANNVQLLRNINRTTQLPFSELVLPGLHPDCIDICNRLLCKNPVNRLSFDEFYQHRSFTRRVLNSPSLMEEEIHGSAKSTPRS